MKKIILLFFFLPFLSFAQNNDCIDSTAINPDCFCFEIYEPVLGCNGEIYSNDCYAQCDGVQYWTPLNQGQSSVCDSIDVNVLSSNNTYIEFEYFANFSSSQSFGYAGFILIDEFGDTVATELIETANNVNGINGGMNETRFLFANDIGYELPFYGDLHLIEGFFAGNYESVCSLPLEINNQAGENDTIELSGQWYSEEEDEYLEFNSNSIYTYSYDSVLDCYDFFYLTYQANDSVIFFEIDGEFNSVNYNLTSTVFTVFFDGETTNYVSESFDSSSFDICTYETFDCTPNGCVSAGDQDGEFDYLEDCEFECEQEQIESWDCIDGSCELQNDSTGAFSSFQSCVDACDITSITDHDISKKVIKITDLLGRDVNSNGIRIYFYEDGTVEKKYFLKR